MRKQTYILAGIALLLGLVALFYNGVPAAVTSMISKLGSKWSNLHPEMQRRALAVIAALAAQGITVGIPSTGGWRSEADQQAIPSSNTNVRDPRDSYHVWGLAVDFVPINAAGAFNWPDASDPVWQNIGAAIKAQGLTWGGDWTGFQDMPHGELKLASLASLKADYSDPLAYVQENNGSLPA